MSSVQMQQIASLMRAARAGSGGAEPSIPELRAAFEQTMTSLPPVPGADTSAVDAGGVAAEWTTWTSPTDGSATSGTILYLHGGAYMQGSPATHRRLVAALAMASGTRALSVDYRLAPEHPFPAAVDDAERAWEWLTGPGGGDPSRVVVSGDSAGGGLTLSLLLRLRDRGGPLPAGAYLMSPWTDLSASGDSARTRRDADPMIDPDSSGRVARLYVPEGDLAAPPWSPLFADLSGLPPLLVHVGDDEVLLDDSTRLAERASAAGVDVECRVWPGAFHVFQALAGIVPEADEALAEAGRWVAARMGTVSQ